MDISGGAVMPYIEFDVDDAATEVTLSDGEDDDQPPPANDEATGSRIPERTYACHNGVL